MGRIKDRVGKIFESEYVYSVFARGYLLVFGFVFMIFRTRFLQEELDGRLSYILSNSEILITFFLFGIPHVYPYFRKKDGEEYRGRFMGMALIMFAAYSVMSVIVYFILRPDFEISVIIFLIPALFLSRSLGRMLLVEKARIRNRAQVLGTTLKLLLVLGACFYANPGLKWIVILAFFESIYNIVAGLAFLKQRPVVDSKTPAAMRGLITVGIWQMFSAVLSSLNYKIDVTMLKPFIGYAGVSVYSKGVMIGEQCWAIPEAMREILLVKMVGGKRQDELCRIMRYSNSFLLFVHIVLAVCGEWLVTTMFGEGYRGSYPILVLILFGSYGMVISLIASIYLLVNGKLALKAGLQAVPTIANIVINLFLIPAYGMMGAAVASVISYSLAGIICGGYLKLKAGCRVRDMLLLKKSDIRDILAIMGRKKKGQ